MAYLTRMVLRGAAPQRGAKKHAALLGIYWYAFYPAVKAGMQRIISRNKPEAPKPEAPKPPVSVQP